MKKSIVDIKAESFSWQIKLIGSLFVFGALFVMNYWWLVIILLVAGLTLLTGYSGTEIDFVNKTFREYSSYLFIRTGAKQKYDRIEKIFISDEKLTMYTAHPNRSSTFRYTVYNAFLKLDGLKIFLTSRKDKDQLIRLLHPVVDSLGVDLTDNTA